MFRASVLIRLCALSVSAVQSNTRTLEQRFAEIQRDFFKKSFIRKNKLINIAPKNCFDE